MDKQLKVNDKVYFSPYKSHSSRFIGRFAIVIRVYTYMGRSAAVVRFIDDDTYYDFYSHDLKVVPKDKLIFER